MHKPSKILFLFLILAYSTHWSVAQAVFSDTNIAHQYDPLATVKAKLQTMPTPMGYKVYFWIETNHPFDNHNIEYAVNTNRSSNIPHLIHGTIEKSSALVRQEGKKALLSYTVETPQNTALVFFLYVFDKQSRVKYEFDVDLPAKSILPDQTPKLYAGATPVQGGFFPTGQFIQDLESGLDNSRGLFGFYYGKNFLPARPPMVTRARNVSDALNIDSTFLLLPRKPIAFNRKGLYLLQIDSATNIGAAFRIESKQYPKPATLEQLVDPLVYITTKIEKNKLNAAKKDKKSFRPVLVRPYEI